MIKIKVYKMSRGHRSIGMHSTPVRDYLYCVYFLGILIRTVTMHDVSRDTARVIFVNVEQIETDEDIQDW